MIEYNKVNEAFTTITPNMPKLETQACDTAKPASNAANPEDYVSQQLETESSTATALAVRL